MAMISLAKLVLSAGIATSFPLYPLETARTRLAIDGDKYRTLYGTLSTVVRQEGFGALYRVRLHC